MATLKPRAVHLPSNGQSADMRLEASKTSRVTTLFVILYSGAVFGRLMYIQPPFSYDYTSYLTVMDILSRLSFHEIIGNNLVFPYVWANGITPIEFGFAALVNVLTNFTDSAEIVYALIASASVGLRVYTMEALRVPRIFILVINIYAITLFESNAIRLGLASSIMLFGLYQFLQSRQVTGYVAVVISVFFHLQLVIFILPFITYFVFSKWITRSKIRIGFFLLASIIASFAFIQLVPALRNVKVVEYVTRAESTSSGLSITSVLAAAFLAFSAMVIRERAQSNKDTKLWSAIVLASAPSAVLLIFLTNVAVIGDRAWQLAFVVLATFFFSGWATDRQKQIPLVFLLALTLTSLVNITVRYPLSNFFSPPFPPIEAGPFYY